MTRQQKDEWRKQQIRAAATRCFVKQGFAATRLLDIAREAGLSKGGVYFHYRAKEALFQEILEGQFKAIEQRWSFDPDLGEAADQALRSLVIAHLRTIEAEPEETRIHHLLVSMAAQDPAVRERLEEAYRVMIKLYATIIRRGVAERVFAERDPEEVAQCVLGMVQGLSNLGAVQSDGRLQLPVEAVADLVVRMASREAAVSLPRTEREPLVVSPPRATHEAGSPAVSLSS